MSELEKKTTVKTIAATQARIHFGEILKRVRRGRERFIVEKDGLAVAVILGREDYEQYCRLLAVQELEGLNKAVNRRMQAKGITEEQALADLEATKKQVFTDQYGHTKAGILNYALSSQKVRAVARVDHLKRKVIRRD